MNLPTLEDKFNRIVDVFILNKSNTLKGLSAFKLTVETFMLDEDSQALLVNVAGSSIKFTKSQKDLHLLIDTEYQCKFKLDSDTTYKLIIYLDTYFYNK